MAYVWRTNRNGKKYSYYQWVRSYREGAKVKQELLFHLGQHPTTEEAMAHHEERVSFYEGVASSRRRGAERIKTDLLERAHALGDFGYVGYLCLYDGMPYEYDEVSWDEEDVDPLDEEALPGEDAAITALKELQAYASFYRLHDYCYWKWHPDPAWSEEFIPYHDYLRSQDIALWEEELDMDIDRARNLLDYYQARREAGRYESALARHRAKLDKLLDVYEKYGGKGK